MAHRVETVVPVSLRQTAPGSLRRSASQVIQRTRWKWKEAREEWKAVGGSSSTAVPPKHKGSEDGEIYDDKTGRTYAPSKGNKRKRNQTDDLDINNNNTGNRKPQIRRSRRLSVKKAKDDEEKKQRQEADEKIEVIDSLLVQAYEHMRTMVEPYSKVTGKDKGNLKKKDFEAWKRFARGALYQKVNGKPKRKTEPKPAMDCVAYCKTPSGFRLYAANSNSLPLPQRRKLNKKYPSNWAIIKPNRNLSCTPQVHAEIQLWEMCPNTNYIGIQQYCCFFCAAQLLAAGFTKFAGCHMSLYSKPYTFSNKIWGNPQYLKRLLGAKVYKAYLKLDDGDKQVFRTWLGELGKRAGTLGITNQKISYAHLDGVYEEEDWSSSDEEEDDMLYTRETTEIWDERFDEKKGVKDKHVFYSYHEASQIPMPKSMELDESSESDDSSKSDDSSTEDSLDHKRRKLNSKDQSSSLNPQTQNQERPKLMLRLGRRNSNSTTRINPTPPQTNEEKQKIILRLGPFNRDTTSQVNTTPQVIPTPQQTNQERPKLVLRLGRRNPNPNPELNFTPQLAPIVFQPASLTLRADEVFNRFGVQANNLQARQEYLDNLLMPYIYEGPEVNNVNPTVKYVFKKKG